MNRLSLEKRKKLNNQEGTFSFFYTFEKSLRTSKRLKILKEVIGRQIFILEKKEDKFIFYYSSPGTDTRVASIKVDKIARDTKKIQFFLVWSAEKIKLCIGDCTNNSELINKDGKQAGKKLRVDKSGNIVNLGDENIDIMQPRIMQNGDERLSSNAINGWEDILESINILKDKSSDKDHLYKTIICNSIIGSLVTGLEKYFEKRFVEIKGEGVSANFDELEKYLSIDDNKAVEMREKAKKNNISYIEWLAKKKINFQNFDKAKNIYKLAYGIKFGSAITKTHKVEGLKKYIEYRHRIIHVSPMVNPLEYMEDNKPVFSDRELVGKAQQIFDDIIRDIHQYSLSIKKNINS